MNAAVQGFWLELFDVIGHKIDRELTCTGEGAAEFTRPDDGRLITIGWHHHPDRPEGRPASDLVLTLADGVWILDWVWAGAGVPPAAYGWLPKAPGSMVCPLCHSYIRHTRTGVVASTVMVLPYPVECDCNRPRCRYHKRRLRRRVVHAACYRKWAQDNVSPAGGEAA